MVQFNTRVYTEQEGQIIGAEVTVYSDSGDKIGVIDVADATTLNELKAQLAVIDETYFTEERLQAILANINENTPINATSLNGFISSDFAKVSQLSSYAPVSHNHTKNQITDLYNYQITASKYNVNIDTDVTITVKVTNQLGNPVVGVTVPVLKDNQAWKSGTTGVNGTFSLTYTADTWGLVMFSANNSNLQINVTGWKLITSNINYEINCLNNKIVEYIIHSSSSVSATGTVKVLDGWIPNGYIPPNNITSVVSHGQIIITCRVDGGVGYRTLSGTVNSKLNATFYWRKS